LIAAIDFSGELAAWLSPGHDHQRRRDLPPSNFVAVQFRHCSMQPFPDSGIEFPATEP
jgi:hypothetical protein